jgi:hypothetical protein
MPITLPVGICSSAFSWRFPNLTDGMLTAGHCAHTGGQVSTPDDPIGTVVATDFENWRVGFGNGTRILPGDNIYRGDLALVQNHPGQASENWIYRGGTTSSTRTEVTATWGRSPAVGDIHRTGGQTSGEISNWEVTTTHIDLNYLFTGGEWVRNITESQHTTGSQTCVESGDSGGSVFTISDSTVVAKGVISGKYELGGWCFVYFTDVRLANAYWNGAVKLT